MYHHIRDLAKQNRIKVTYVPTEDMAADGLTKVLNPINISSSQGFWVYQAVEVLQSLGDVTTKAEWEY